MRTQPSTARNRRTKIHVARGPSALGAALGLLGLLTFAAAAHAEEVLWLIPLREFGWTDVPEFLGVYAVRGDVWRPVDFQVEPRDQRGVFQPGPRKPGEWDTLVVRVSDAGDLATPPAALPAKCLRADGRMLRIQESPRGFLLCPTDAAISQAQPLRRMPRLNGVESPYYRMGFRDLEVPGVWDFFEVRHADGSWSGNLIDRFKFRFELQFRLASIRFQSHEAKLRLREDHWFGGPVRIIRFARFGVDLLPGLSSPTADVELAYAQRSLSAEVTVKVPFKPSLVIRDARAWLALDFADAAVGWWGSADSIYPSAFTIDGALSEVEQRLRRPDADHDWSMIGSGGTRIQSRLTALEPLPIRKRTWYNDDREAATPMDRHPGKFGQMGYEISDIHKMDAGRIHYRYELIVLEPGSTPRAEKPAAPGWSIERVPIAPSAP